MPHAAPTIDSPRPNATPKDAQPYGDMCVNTSDHPWLQYSEEHVADDELILFVNLISYRRRELVFATGFFRQLYSEENSIRGGIR